MASPTPEQQQELYASIERLYSEGKWDAVLEASQALLAALPAGSDHPLRPRLDLVIGHTLLYGLKDPAGAEQRYNAVLLDTEEPVLREIAAQGLERCREQDQANLAAVPEADADAALEVPSENAAPAPVEAGQDLAAAAEAPSQAAEGDSPGAAAMPWLVELGGVEPSNPTPIEAGPGAETPFKAAIRLSESAELPADSGSTSTEDTLALLREPEPLIPVTVELVEDAPTSEPLLSPDAMAELARGLLEVELR
jgi:hypothetical protein